MNGRRRCAGKVPTSISASGRMKWAISRISPMPSPGCRRSRKLISGIECFAGSDEFDSFLKRTDILVCLLPHTPETTGLINGEVIAKLSRNGPFGPPILINAGRGKQQVESDILAALD